MLMSYFVVLIMMMSGVSFFVLLERKILSSIHLREGPKKVWVGGLAQPFCDGGKLFSKGINIPSKASYFIFLFSPLLGLMLCFFSWLLFTLEFDSMDLVLGFLVFLCLSSMNVYVMVMSGWSSNSVYSMFGSCRGVAQSISYEVTMALLMMGVISVSKCFNLGELAGKSEIFSSCLVSMVVWFGVMLAESNRSPYDFVEGESELVSGYNVEYSSIGFSLLFLSEYGMMLFMAYFGELFFFGWLGGIIMLLLIVMFIWIRGVLPRYRYDKLMSVAWKFFLYYSLCFLIFIMGVVNFLGIFISG